MSPLHSIYHAAGPPFLCNHFAWKYSTERNTAFLQGALSIHLPLSQSLYATIITKDPPSSNIHTAMRCSQSKTDKDQLGLSHGSDFKICEHVAPYAAQPARWHRYGIALARTYGFNSTIFAIAMRSTRTGKTILQGFLVCVCIREMLPSDHPMSRAPPKGHNMVYLELYHGLYLEQAHDRHVPYMSCMRNNA